MLPNMRSLIKKHLLILHSDTNLKNIFPEREIYLKEILSLSLYTKRKNDKKD